VNRTGFTTTIPLEILLAAGQNSPIRLHFNQDSIAWTEPQSFQDTLRYRQFPVFGNLHYWHLQASSPGMMLAHVT
jgi:hypothetical protein